MDTFTALTPRQLRRAANVKEKIDALQQELSRLLGAPATTEDTAQPRRRKVSAAGIARMRAAQRARWAAFRRGQTTEAPARKRKRKFSAAGRARLAALARARWAQARAAGKSTL